MNIDNEIFILDENEVSVLSEKKPEPPDDIGLTEQVIKTENPRLIGDNEIKITSSPFVIGKDESCNFTINGDTYISRRHCRIIKKEDGYYIEDINSTNGTFIDGKRISSRKKLEVGQEVKLADRNYVWEE